MNIDIFNIYMCSLKYKYKLKFLGWESYKKSCYNYSSNYYRNMLCIKLKFLPSDDCWPCYVHRYKEGK